MDKHFDPKHEHGFQWCVDHKTGQLHVRRTLADARPEARIRAAMRETLGRDVSTRKGDKLGLAHYTPERRTPAGERLKQAEIVLHPLYGAEVPKGLGEYFRRAFPRASQRIGSTRVRQQAKKRARKQAAAKSWYHLTDNPKFELDPKYKPLNNTTIGGDWPEPGLFLTDAPESWYQGHDYVRPYVVELHADPKNIGGYSGEHFLPASGFARTQVKRVLPYEAFMNEKFENTPYTGPDVREFTPEQHAAELQRLNEEISLNKAHMLSFPCERCGENARYNKCEYCDATLDPSFDPYMFRGYMPQHRGTGEFYKDSGLQDRFEPEFKFNVGDRFIHANGWTGTITYQRAPWAQLADQNEAWAHRDDTGDAFVIVNMKNCRPIEHQGELNGDGFGWQSAVKRQQKLAMAVEVVGSVFQGPGQDGDFTWMIEQPEYADALFVFNDNEEQFRSHSCSPGGGNAAIRPYQCQNPPRATGIPTGLKGQGYSSLTQEARAVIDEALARVRELTSTGHYRRLIYSDDGQGSLGTGIFQVGDEVRDYIVRGLHASGGWHMSAVKQADHNGYTNWHTWNTALMIDNDQDLYNASRKAIENGMTLEQFRDWVIPRVIGPHNRDAIADAKEWNSIPEEERIDHSLEEMKKRSPENEQLYNDLFGQGDVADSEPTLIDQEIVNWEEIYNGIKEEFEEEAKYKREAERLEGMGLDFAMPGHTDETNQMLDAWLKHHGVDPQAASFGDDRPRSEFGHRTFVPIDQLNPNEFTDAYWQEEVVPNGGYLKGTRDVGWDTLWKIQKGSATPEEIATMQQALQGQGYPPEQVAQIMRQTQRYDPSTDRWEMIEKQAPVVDPSLDQAGELTIPEDWHTGKTADVRDRLRRYQRGDRVHNHSNGFGTIVSEMGMNPTYGQEWLVEWDKPDALAGWKALREWHPVELLGPNRSIVGEQMIKPAPGGGLQETLGELRLDGTSDTLASKTAKVAGLWHELPVAYHVAPPEKREQIQRDGLRAQNPLVPSGHKGVYLWDSPKSAKQMSGDLYEVKLPIPHVMRDPNPGYTGAYVYPGDIPPENLTLLDQRTAKVADIQTRLRGFPQPGDRVVFKNKMRAEYGTVIDRKVVDEDDELGDRSLVRWEDLSPWSNREPEEWVATRILSEPEQGELFRPSVGQPPRPGLS